MNDAHRMTAAFGKITVSAHACDEATKDFRVPRQTAEEWIRSNLRKASFVSNIVGENGNPCRLFGFQRIAFVMDASADHVITIYPQHYVESAVKRGVQSVVMRALRNAERQERKVEREVRIEKARLGIERAECIWRMEMTPSAKVKRSNTDKMAQIDAKITELNAKLIEAQKAKKSVAKSVIAYL